MRLLLCLRVVRVVVRVKVVVKVVVMVRVRVFYTQGKRAWLVQREADTLGLQQRFTSSGCLLCLSESLVSLLRLPLLEHRVEV